MKILKQLYKYKYTYVDLQWTPVNDVPLYNLTIQINYMMWTCNTYVLIHK